MSASPWSVFAVLPLVASSVGLVLGSALGGCSATSTAAAYGDVDAYCTGRARAECSVADLCTVPEGACMEARRDSCQGEVKVASKEGRVYRPELADQCIFATRLAHQAGRLLAQDLDPTSPGSMADACGRVLDGVALNGMACQRDLDCAFPLVCDARKGVTVPVRLCSSAVKREHGEPCANAGEYCATGYYCNAAVTQPVCVVRKTKDERCGADEPCAETLRCVLDATSGGGGGRCQERLPLGASCTQSDECAAGAPVCDPYAGSVCGPALVFTGASPVCKAYGKS